jgi:hypothetical protein
MLTGERRSTIMVMPFIISSISSNLFNTKYIMTSLYFQVGFFLPVRTRHFLTFLLLSTCYTNN